METIGERIRRARLRKVMTQEQLAERAEMQPITVSRIENDKGSTAPRQSTIQKIAKALDVSPVWIMFGDEDEKSDR